MKNLLFNLGLATLFTHELDAITQKEWHLLYILRDLPEKAAAQIFVIVHVPLFALIFWLVFNAKLNIKEWSKIILASFFIIHAVLHKALESHPLYTFDSLMSQGLIFGAGLLGLIYLIITYFTSRAKLNLNLE